MRSFLSDFIFSQASKSREKIQNILAAAQVGKSDLDSLVSRIESIQTRAPIVVRPEAYGGLVTSSGLDSVHRDTNLRLQELYDESNLISLLLDTHTEILSSEVKQQLDQLDSYEKFINNYTFMLADESFYDYSYTETFTDSIQQETSSYLNNLLYDRSGISFDRQTELLGVDSGHGVLALSSQFLKSYPITGYELRSNCRAFITSNTGIAKSTNPLAGEGWRISISSPRPIISSIDSGTDKGAQMELDFWLDNPSLCDSISLNPMADLPIQILSVKVYEDYSASGEEILSSSVNLDTNKIIHFTQRTVAKVKIVVNQSVYKRNELMPSSVEDDYRKVAVVQKEIQKLNKPEVKLSSKAFQRLYSKWFLAKEKARAKLVRPQDRINRYNAEDMNLQDALSYEKDQHNLYSQFKLESNRKDIFKQWIIDKLFRDQPDLLDRYSATEQRTGISGISPLITVANDTVNDTSFDYKYTLGLKSVEVGLAANKNRGLFISKPVPVPVQSGQVRIQVDDTNYYLKNSILDNKFVTSIEYSVTNKSNPVLESDWIPIVPANKGEEVVDERLFPQSSGYAKFRFQAEPTGNIEIYKNGFRLDTVAAPFVRAEDSNAIIGVRISPAHFSLNSDDIFTAKYLPNADSSTVNFQDHGFGGKSLASAFDDNGAGEYFDGSSSRRTVDLRNYPYVDFKRLESSTYSPLVGLVGSYQPISIVLADGTIAYNYTNYTGLIQNEMDSTNSAVTFLQSGKHIIFNKDVDQSFRVFYQYEPSYLRYRIIYRINYPQRVSPLVDTLSIKTKMNASILGLNNKKV